MFNNTSKNEISGPNLLTAVDVARRLSITKRYAYHLMETGQIPCLWIGRCIRVLPADLEAYIDSLPRNRG